MGSMDDLTDRQRAILEMLHDHQAAHGYPPSVREIGDAVGLASPSSVHAQLATLEGKGFLRRDPTKPRALELSASGDFVPHVPAEHARHVPLVGQIAAGGPIIAEQSVESPAAQTSARARCSC